MRPLVPRIVAAAVAALGPTASGGLIDIPPLGLRIEEGFRVTQISDEQIANDIWCMTLTPKGEPFVSGPGYLSTLLDADGDGRMDKTIKFAETKGAMGLCFDETGKQLLVMAEGWLWEYRDENLDRVADGPPRKILPFASGEHGGHAIRRGPDGWWWVIGGNDAGINERHQPKPSGIGGDSPSLPVAGAIVRISPDFKESAVWADGFRNPYDFDFNERGDVFTYDSDCERDYFLPWYSGCRVYHAQVGRHHGWRLPGHLRSFRVPDYMPETVPALADLGRGSPTGVHVYKSSRFPRQYHGGLFVADWTFGRIYHLPLAAEATRYVTRPEVFLEPIGRAGFAPTDIVETKDGAMLISIGGRKTRGAIFRIEPTETSNTPALQILAHPEPPPPAALVELANAQTKMGGWKLTGAEAEAFVPYEAARPDGLSNEERSSAITTAENALFSLDDRAVAEGARLLAMVGSNSSRNVDNLLAKISETSPVTADFHFLACIARMPVEASAERTAKIAHAILDLDRKLAGGDRRPKQMWPVRLNEVTARLIKLHPALPDALLAHPSFATIGHLHLVDAMPAAHRAKAAALYMAATKAELSMEWSPELVKLLATEPDARPILRAQWKNIALRPALRDALRRNPTEEDSALLETKEPGPAPEDPATTAAFVDGLKPVVWDKGDATRGEKIFRERACATCHAGTSPLGPDLSGPVARLSAPDLITDIQFPNRSISDAFRARLFTMKDGTQRNGFVAFLSADGVIVQTGPGLTERLPQTDIVSEVASQTSLMPPGLLSGLDAAQLADFYAYLRTLAK